MKKRMNDFESRILNRALGNSRRRVIGGDCRLFIRDPQSAVPSRFPRRGISLLEVLISMFVLLFGLMGVASIFPVGNHYAGRGDQFDRGAALADAAFAQLKSRGLLQPEQWLYGGRSSNGRNLTPPYSLLGPTGLYQIPLPTKPDDPHPGHAFIIDPLGTPGDNRWPWTDADAFPMYQPRPGGNAVDEVTANSAMSDSWSNLMASRGVVPGGSWPLRRVSAPMPDAAAPAAQARRQRPLSQRAAQALCALPDDLAVELPAENDRPGIQRWETADVDASGSPNNTPEDPRDDMPLARQSSHNYSWLATVVPTTSAGVAALQPSHPMFGSELYEVSVAVFHKRDLTTPGAAERSLPAQMNPGGELVLYYDLAGDFFRNTEYVDAAVQDVRPGHWIAIAGVHPTSGRFLLKWYRLLSLDEESQQNQTGAGLYKVPPTTPGLYNAGQLAVRVAMVDGPEWPRDPDPAKVNLPVENLLAILMPRVIGVSTQYLPMER